MAIFNGRNVFLGYINGKEVLLDKLIYRYDPSIISFGKSLSQASYDLIIPESNQYYAISSEFEQISELYNVYNLSQEEYEELSTYDKNSLYIVKDNDEITNAYVGDTRLDKLYLGETTIWSYQKTPNWYKDGWQELFLDDSWYYPLCVTVVAATTPSSGNVPNCTVLKCSFSDYYSYTSTPASVQLINNTATSGQVRATRSNDGKKRQSVIYNAVTNTWGTVTTGTDSLSPTIDNVMLTQSVPAFIYSKRIPSGYPDITTNIPYIEGL